MTNRTTEQDMEAESVDKNDATLIKSPDNSEEMTTEAISNNDTQNIINEVNETPEGIHSDVDLPDEAVKETEEAVPDEPALVEEEPDYSIIAPGSLSRALKKCREEADFSVEDAAQEMRLPLTVVKALESENFAELPDPPYVRGYLRSYARLNESDATNLINHYETLRGADPKDIASFTPVTPRYQPNSKKAVSPTTIKLAGFSMIVMLLVVLSMIPAVSQWASDTWQSFSEPQNQKLAATAKQSTEAETTDNTEQDNGAQETEGTGNTDSTASSSDTATPDNSEQLALNQEAADTATQDQNTDTATDNTETTEQDKTPEQAADAPAGDTEQAAEETGTTEPASESAATDNTQDMAADQNTDKTDPTATAATTSDTDTSAATDTNADTAQAVATAEAEAAAAKQQQEQADAEKAAAEKAEADKLAAQQAEAAKQEDKFQQPIDGSVLIRLVFSQDVWMSIKDGRGKTIFGALNAAGTRKELKATTPLQFKVGNAPGVQIYLNGQLIDQKPYTRGSVSTFRAN